MSPKEVLPGYGTFWDGTTSTRPTPLHAYADTGRM